MKSDTTSREEGRLVLLLSSIAFALVLALVLLTPFFEMTSAVPPEQRVYRLYGYGLLLALELVAIPIRGWKRSLRSLATPALAAVVWFCLSLVWAQHFELAGKRVFLLCLVYIGIFGSVGDLGYQRSLLIIRVLLVAALVLNLFAVFAFPDFGTQGWKEYDLWRGIMAHKNIAGLVSAATIVVFALDAKQVPVALRVPVLIGAAVFLYQSWSRTAMIATLIAVIFGLVLTLLKTGARISLAGKQAAIVKGAWVSLAVILVAILALTIQRDFLLSFTDDAGALSLRTSIWRPMIQFYLDHPILGSGYGAFWDATVNTETDSAYATQKWLKQVDQGHNGYLDLLVQTGLPGLALALAAALAWPLTRFATLTERLPERAPLVFALVLFVLVENFAESSLFADDAIANFFLFFALAHIHRFALRSESKPVRRRRKTASPAEELNRAAARGSV